jgi:hypothetical protein
VSKLISIHLDEAERFKHSGAARKEPQSEASPASA